MSHFAVTVFTKEGQTVEELMLPYQENNMSTCLKQFLEFHDIEEESRNEFENKTRSEFYCASSSSWGQAVHSDIYQSLKSHNVGDRIQISIPEREGASLGYFKKGEHYHCYDNAETSRPEEHIWIKVTKILKTDHPDPNVCFEGELEIQLVEDPKDISLAEYYDNDFDLYMREWHGHEERDSENGRYGYWENPNSKWDWYQIGGRFSGLLHLKSGASSGEYGKRSWTNKDLVISDNRVDSAKVKDIDFSMDTKAYQEALRYWELVVEGSTPQNKEEEEMVSYSFYKPQYYTNRYDSKEHYAEETASFQTYAVVTPDGVWHAKGEMGWFGCSSESDTEAKKWSKSFEEMFIQPADPEWTLTVVDCHI